MPKPLAKADFSPDIAVAGPAIPPLERVRIFSSTQWEEFVQEWADSLESAYGTVHRCGGAGDMGRDVVAFDKNDPAVWDNYQCKHYAAPVSIGEVKLEVGKVLYYTFTGGYTVPRRSYFVAPRDCSTPASNLLADPQKLRTAMLQDWDRVCKDNITATAAIPLDGDFLKHVQSFDFSIFGTKPVLAVIKAHQQTRWFVFRFGGGLPTRGPSTPPPSTPAPHEAIYVRALLDAYEDHLRVPVADVDALAGDLLGHLHESRVEFYCAEALRVFSRDNVPPGEFERLQDDVHSGISSVLRRPASSGYLRCLDATAAAKLLPLAHHVLNARTAPADRGGICHQMANETRIRWRSV
jgi:hypothetical protein